MKKVAFISLLSVFLIMSCRDRKFIPDGSLVNDEKQTKENEVTTEVEDSFLVVVDTMEVDPVVSNDVISRGDLGIFELRGPVKKCVSKYSGYSVTCTFSKEGIWLSENGQSLSSMYPGEIKRDKKGRLISACNEGDIFIGYEYDERGLVVKSYDGGESINYYDADGNLIKRPDCVTKVYESLARYVKKLAPYTEVEYRPANPHYDKIKRKVYITPQCLALVREQDYKLL